MTGNIWKSALALGAVLAVAGPSSAQNSDTLRLSGGPTGATMTLGGTGTVEDAATEDIELAHYKKFGYYGGYGGYKGYYGGYRGFYGGSGYRGFYPGYGGYGYRNFGYSGYRGFYGYPSFGYSRPFYGYGYRPYYPYYGGSGFFIGFRISADTDALNTPAVPLGGSVKPAQPAQPMMVPLGPDNGTFPYDGGPAKPVPLPTPDAKPMTPPAPQPGANDLPVSLKPKIGITPPKYKAYGEK